ncbi:OmpA family protein [Salinisphaera sp.]|uniref:OmpA family protein n=1 Tax=Salinisphaera sp. TaxID=1914330 RepID=UPI000C402254|nr:OmpA family protein [Salinisphaera sp.]MBS63975.1 cell envelope biogenesis protein OmpA [Salinisphaera sp.]
MIKQLCVALALVSATAVVQAQTQNQDSSTSEANAPRARVSGTAPTNQVVVTGVVPNENTKAVVLKRLRAIYGDDRVIDEVTIGDVVAPPNWETYLDRMLVSDLSNVSRGKLVIKGNDAQISGDVVNEAQRQDIVSKMATQLNPSYSIENNLAIGASEQKILDDALANRTIEFESGSATLTPKGLQIVDEMAGPIRKLENKRVEIIGHTDNSGSRLANLALSANRAEAVKAALVDKGIPAKSLITLGAGSQRPIASNDTAAGRARNRRIEFRIRNADNNDDAE